MDQHLYPDKPLKASLIEKVRQPLFIPETLILTKLLRFFRTKGVHEAVVIDEYGTLSGLITLHDVLEEIVGDMPGDKQDIIDEKNKFIRRSENSWLVEGLCSIDEFREYFHIEEELPGEAEDYYKTLGALSPTCSATFRKKRKKQPMTDSHSKSWTATTAEWIRYW